MHKESLNENEINKKNRLTESVSGIQAGTETDGQWGWGWRE